MVSNEMDEAQRTTIKVLGSVCKYIKNHHECMKSFSLVTDAMESTIEQITQEMKFLLKDQLCKLDEKLVAEYKDFIEEDSSLRNAMAVNNNIEFDSRTAVVRPEMPEEDDSYLQNSYGFETTKFEDKIPMSIVEEDADTSKTTSEANLHPHSTSQSTRLLTEELCNNIDFNQFAKEVDGRKVYCCNICHKNFNNNYTLKRHYRIHTGERPYQCSYCFKSFRNAHHVKSHMESKHKCTNEHTGTEDVSVSNEQEEDVVQENKDISHEELEEEANDAVTYNDGGTSVDPEENDISLDKLQQSFLGSETTIPAEACKSSNQESIKCKSEFSTQTLIPREVTMVERTAQRPPSFHTTEEEEESEEVIKQKPLKCDVCKKRFKHMCQMKRHYRIHTGEKPYSCPVCNKSFRHLHHVKGHMSSIHKEVVHEAEAQADEHDGFRDMALIGQTNDFVDYVEQNRLQMIENGQQKEQEEDEIDDVHHASYLDDEGLSMVSQQKYKTFSCYICQKTFSQPSELRRHCRIHTGEKPCNCPICDKAFRLPHHVKSHVKRVHDANYDDLLNMEEVPSADRMIPVKVDIKEQEEKVNAVTFIKLKPNPKRSTLMLYRFPCDICHKNFPNQSRLKRHSLIHTGEKPYQCQVCDKKFRNLHHLKGHMQCKHKTEYKLLENKLYKHKRKASAKIKRPEDISLEEGKEIDPITNHFDVVNEQQTLSNVKLESTE